MNMKEKQYLGDGVYAQNDGFELILTTENGVATTNTIVIKPMVYQALLDYMNECVKSTMGS